MEKVAVYMWLLTLGVFICVATPLLQTIFSIFVLGYVPGTSIVISPLVMLVTYPLLFVALVAWISFQSLYIGEIKKPAQSVIPVKVKKTPAKRKRAVRTTTAKRRVRTAS